MGNNAIVSGSFSTIGGSTRYGLASIGLNTGTASSWAPLNSAPAYAKVHFYRDTTLLITNSTAIVGVDTYYRCYENNVFHRELCHILCFMGQ